MRPTNTLTLRHQNFMLAVRREMGWPAFKPANDCIAFCASRPMDFETGSEMARVAQMLNKDAIFTGWTSGTAARPASFAIVYRELLTIDIIDRVVPYAANDDDPIVFVNVRGHETFTVDERGSLRRIPGQPGNIGRGRQRAMKRIRATAAKLGGDLLASNRFVPTGAEWIEPEVPVETVVRFA